MSTDYPLYVKWTNVLDWILDRCEGFPKSVRFTLSDRIANLALDILEKIVETIYSRHKKPFLIAINLALEKLRVLFRISYSRKYLAINQYEYISKELDETGKMAGGWIKSEKDEKKG